MKILISGSNGLLGQKLVKQLSERNIEFLATSKGDNRNPDCPITCYQSIDITDKNQVEDVVKSFMPDSIIHTAAITNVDYCEMNPELCHKVNVLGTQNIFEVAKNINAHFQLLSTDFVFDGAKGNYKETDRPNPLSIYASSKFEGEKLLMNSDYKNWSIARTIIVFGEGKNLSRSNIVLWAKDALMKGSPLNIIDDQFRAPTWADDLAWGCIEICKLNGKGIYHLSGPETMSIYDLVLRVAKFYKLGTEHINRTDSKSLNQPAKRPPKTGFDISKAKRELGYRPKSLEESLSLLS